VDVLRRRLENPLFGDTHMYGPDSIRFYTRGKVVTTRWPDPSTSVIDLGSAGRLSVRRTEPNPAGG
jgi:hypothetical protein